MAAKGNSKPERNGTPDRERFGLTREDLAGEFRRLADNGGSGLNQEPVDGELWPTEGLSDNQIELLTGKLEKVRRKS